MITFPCGQSTGSIKKGGKLQGKRATNIQERITSFLFFFSMIWFGVVAKMPHP
jgi:hypothetical protein